MDSVSVLWWIDVRVDSGAAETSVEVASTQLEVFRSVIKIDATQHGKLFTVKSTMEDLNIWIDNVLSIWCA